MLSAGRVEVSVRSPKRSVGNGPRRTVKLTDLADEPLITLPAGSGIRAALDAGFAAAENTETPQHDIRKITITNPPMRARLALAWKENFRPGPATIALISHITQQTRSH